MGDHDRCRGQHETESRRRLLTQLLRPFDSRLWRLPDLHEIRHRGVDQNVERAGFAIDLQSYAMRDYFAELFVAGRFAEAGWNVYFPHRDEGFDFLVAKNTGRGHQLIRPVQVKGKYPRRGKKNKPTYGY